MQHQLSETLARAANRCLHSQYICADTTLIVLSLCPERKRLDIFYLMELTGDRWPDQHFLVSLVWFG